MLSMAVRRSPARLVSSRVGVFAWLALCWCWRRWRGGAWPLPGWRCWRSAACLAHGWAGAFAWLAGVGAGAVYRLAALACAGPVCSAAGQLPGRHTRLTPPRLAPAPVRACPSCRRAPAPPSPDGPPKTATARHRGYLPRPVSSPGKLCYYAPYSPPACAICTENRHGFLCKNNSQAP